MTRPDKGNAAWRQAVAPYRRPAAVPRRGSTALLVIDMQRYFASMAAGILANAARLIEGCRDAGIPVLYTRHGHKDPVKDGGMLKEWWDELILERGPEAEFISEIAPRPGEKVIGKRRYNAFFGTKLDATLRSLGISDLIVAGVMTNLCCETTAREAFVRDYRVFFVADATATASEELHLAALRNLAFGFAHVVGAEELLKAFRPSY
ncbi:MAG: isochorismatase family protein [Elusimicrobiota bacterium]